MNTNQDNHQTKDENNKIKNPPKTHPEELEQHTQKQCHTQQRDDPQAKSY